MSRPVYNAVKWYCRDAEGLRVLLRSLTAAQIGLEWKPRTIAESWVSLADLELVELLKASVGPAVVTSLREKDFWIDGLHPLLGFPTVDATLDAMEVWLALTEEGGAKAAARWGVAIDLLCQRLDVSRHGWHTAWDRPFCETPSTAEGFLQQWRGRALLEAISALRETLGTPEPSPGTENREVLLVDDQPKAGGLESLVRLVVESFSIGVYRALIPRSIKFDKLCSVAGYSTFGGFDESSAQMVAGILSRTRVVLVDQRLGPGNRPEEDGSRVIAGLLRFIADYWQRFEASVPPLIVALSREDNAEAVLAARRGGAVGYLPKRRLLELPALLSRVEAAGLRGVDHGDRPATSGRREALSLPRENFRELWRLPRRTIGLLRAGRIPKLDLHKGDVPAINSQIRSAARLVEAFPKADLHVHVGSCMAPEFLIIASLVGLLRHKRDTALRLIIPARDFYRTALANPHVTVEIDGHSSSYFGKGDKASYKGWIEAAGDAVAAALVAGASDAGVRSLAHTLLGIPSHLPICKFDSKVKERGGRFARAFLIPRLRILKASAESLELNEWAMKRDSIDDLLRIYLLVLGSQTWSIVAEDPEEDFLALFRENESELPALWDRLQERLFPIRKQTVEGDLDYEAFRRAGWSWPTTLSFPLQVKQRAGGETGVLEASERFAAPLDPVSEALASGLWSENLDDYLQGCEFAGAMHLKHPALIHLYAEHVVADLVCQGVIYAELRGSPDGYLSRQFGFEFADVCACMLRAFSDAQQTVLDWSRNGNSHNWHGGGALAPRYGADTLKKVLQHTRILQRRLPVKVSLVLVGKRHKATRDMVLEAAAVAMLKPAADRPVYTAMEFVAKEMPRCRVVGFDLAGSEAGFRPGLFSEEFSRLARLHIPITVHAGENASSQFVGEAIVDLRARRIGHGLTMIEDGALMARARDEGTCIELCPVSNYQTSLFSPATRPYPLETYLSRGLVVTINTDNPRISNTDLVKEYFQASFSTSSGLSLWDSLRIMRFGFTSAFLSFPERRALLILAEQRLLDLLADIEVLRDLEELSAPPATSTLL